MLVARLALPIPGRRHLQAALDALTLWNRRHLRASGPVPPLYRTRVRYRREKPGREQWMPIPLVLAQGYGDCEDLACWRAAEIGGRAVPLRVRTGWHIVVRRPDGRIEDPSRRLGMGNG